MEGSTTKHGIKEEYWALILSLLKSEAKVSDVILYGSRAKGNYKPGSDIDICLKGIGIGMAEIRTLLIKLDDLDLPWRVDLSAYDLITNADLLDHIDRIGIKL
jgi:predicted nucleotidyltransferase